MQKPEIRCLRRRELGQHFPALAAWGGQRGAFRSEDLNLPPQQHGQITAGCEIETRRGELRIEDRNACRVARHLRDAEGGKSIAVLVFKEKAKGSRGDLYGL